MGEIDLSVKRGSELAKQIESEVDIMNPVNGSSSRNNTNVKANTSLLLGIISIVFIFVTMFGIVFAIIGLVFGLIGLKEIKHTEQPGRGKAIAGIICSTVAIVIPLVIFFFTTA